LTGTRQEKPPNAEEKARELGRLVQTWNKACTERGKPTGTWNLDAINQYDRSYLHAFIRETRLNQIPDKELLTRLGCLVDHLASNSLVVDQLDVFSLRTFVHNRAAVVAMMRQMQAT
jgi:hypothetical protein